MQTIALFGTSADPPTLGHQAILSWLADHYDRVAVWASDNPFKSHQTPLPHRMAMLQLLIDEIQPPRHNLQLYPQLSRPRTLHTVEIARTIWSNAAFTLVVGSDLISQLPSWYQADALLNQVKLLVVPRSGHPLNRAALTELRHRGADLAIADMIAPDTSSTAYRENGDPDEITPPIEAYIHRERLYAWQENSRERQRMR